MLIISLIKHKLLQKDRKLLTFFSSLGLVRFNIRVRVSQGQLCSTSPCIRVRVRVTLGLFMARQGQSCSIYASSSANYFQKLKRLLTFSPFFELGRVRVSQGCGYLVLLTVSKCQLVLVMLIISLIKRKLLPKTKEAVNIFPFFRVRVTSCQCQLGFVRVGQGQSCSISPS